MFTDPSIDLCRWHHTTASSPLDATQLWSVIETNLRKTIEKKYDQNIPLYYLYVEKNSTSPASMTTRSKRVWQMHTKLKKKLTAKKIYQWGCMINHLLNDYLTHRKDKFFKKLNQAMKGFHHIHHNLHLKIKTRLLYMMLSWIIQQKKIILFLELLRLRMK